MKKAYLEPEINQISLVGDIMIVSNEFYDPENGMGGGAIPGEETGGLMG